MGSVESRIATLSEMLAELLAAKVYRLGDIINEPPAAAAVEGVYLFSSPSTPSSLVYAGRTKTKTILGRFKDHSRINTPSDLRGMLLRLPDMPQTSSEYGARWLAVPDPIERSQFELFVIAVLAPPFNRYNVHAMAPKPMA